MVGFLLWPGTKMFHLGGVLMILTASCFSYMKEFVASYVWILHLWVFEVRP